LLTSAGLCPPSVSKTAALTNKLFPFFGLTSLTNEQILRPAVRIFHVSNASFVFTICLRL
ncbi:MAG: hypothetical protein LUF77_04980, partial [Oscillospiraceae bacterium]|nr:hypothetical protein [Oscillospiraceae bacterium]